MKGYRLFFFALLAGVLVLGSACSSDDPVTGTSRGNFRIVISGEGETGGAASGSSVSALGGDSGVAMSPDDDSSGDGGGNDPVRKLSEVNVTFTSMLARNLDGQLIDVDMELPRTLDLLSLLDGGQATLPIGFLPPGMYDQLVVVMADVEFVTLNGTSFLITPPGGGWTAIIETCVFEVIEGETTSIRIKFRPRRSIKQLVNGTWHFDPFFECDEPAPPEPTE
jgi:hypothetical protein